MLPLTPQEPRNFRKLMKLGLMWFLKNGSLDTVQPAETDGK